jgi:hypothetical protein
MVYEVIKEFARNKEKFQESNLIDLTCQVVYQKRGDIFPEGTKAVESKK